MVACTTILLTTKEVGLLFVMLTVICFSSVNYLFISSTCRSMDFVFFLSIYSAILGIVTICESLRIINLIFLSYSFATVHSMSHVYILFYFCVT